MLRLKNILILSIYFLIFSLCLFTVDINEIYGKDQPVNGSSQDMATTQKAQINSASESENGTPAGINSTSGNAENSAEMTNKQEKERDIMEEALQLLDESRSYWVKGDLENAIDMLDQAYALLLDTNGDPYISRQKDDLRLLISKKILAIYSSMHTTTQGKRSEIPYILNADVEKEIRQFQTVEREFFIQSYKRSGMVRPIILRELNKAGLPEELSWLPLVESGFKIHALSRARALGPWQFIPSTGYKYGLNRDEWIDERLDIEKSTRAAIDYLKDLHGMFGDWLTVLAAYNCGEGRVLKVISRQHINYLDRFWDLYHQLPYETARYVPRFLATLLIIKDPKKYGMHLEDGTDQPYSYEIVKTSKSMKLKDIASHAGISEDALTTLNSELRYSITPDKEYNLKVPLETTEKFVKVVDEIPQQEKPRQAFIKHRVKRGESAASIARRYGLSVGTLMSYNNLSSRKRVKVGQRLTIPVSGNRYARVKTVNKQTDGSKTNVNDGVIKYKVKKGDTLSSLARMNDTSVNEIQKMNKMKKATIRPGQIILLNSGANSPRDEKQSPNMNKKVSKKKSIKTKKETSDSDPKTYIVQKGDSLDKIAKKNKTSLDKILEMNKLARDDRIQPGQVIVVK